MAHNIDICGVCNSSMEEEFAVVEEENITVESKPSLIGPKNYWSSDEENEKYKEGVTCVTCKNNGHKWAGCKARLWDEACSTRICRDKGLFSP
eukprot:1133671-Ditylum_brightwellii.AAC.1